jgi:hypothetical protein
MTNDGDMLARLAKVEGICLMRRLLAIPNA